MSRKQKWQRFWGWFLVITFGMGFCGTISIKPIFIGSLICEIGFCILGISMILKSKKPVQEVKPQGSKAIPQTEPEKVKTYITICCAACGAPAKVPLGGISVCEYCGSLVQDNNSTKHKTTRSR